MAQTPNTSSGPYATITMMTQKYDVRTLGDLLSDTKIRLTPAAVLSSSTLAFLMLTVSGELESACYHAQRYTPTDLLALTGATQAYLQDLICDLTMAKLLQRRPMITALPAQCIEAKMALERLKLGEAIFSTVESSYAGVHVERVVETDCLLTQAAVRMFGNTFNDYQSGGWNGGCGCR